ncbi:MAG: chaperone ATPase [Candidatus Berkelbacteria bacterium Licking1014_7]|uniref:Chaperone ATPase n=1 Tax=Candidatus Berkelbacteria bacterium Licking1014_7 TaxID=2017147 RepID=A0A554LJB0_9BACT|nr:MAG: chaperone ATPase [Candidatus Berkelbacteria bacterium Licking1014_7]
MAGGRFEICILNFIMDPNIFKKFSDNARKIMTAGQRIAKEMRSSLNSEHLLIALSLTPGTLAYEILQDPNNRISADQIRLILSLRGPESGLTTGISNQAKKILEQASMMALDFHHSQIDAEHILLGITTLPDSAAYQIITRLGINPRNIRDQILGIFEGLSTIEKLSHKLSQSHPDMPFPEGLIEFKFFKAPAIQGVPTKTPALAQFAQNLTKKAQNGKIDPVVSRQAEILRIIQILSRKTKNNPVLIGDSGVGKTAIVEGLAQQIVQNKIPPALIGKQIYSLDLALIVAGTSYRGQFEARIKKIIDEIKKDKNIILFIDELHTLIGAGAAEGSLDAANILKPALAKGDIHLIGATTIDEYRKHIERDPALERRLQTILIKEPTINQTINILSGIRAVYEHHHKVKITDQALIASATLSARYIADRFLPDKAIDLIDEASAAKQIKNAARFALKKVNQKQNKLEKILTQKNQAIDNQDFNTAAQLRLEEIRVRQELKKTTRKNSETLPSVTSEDIAEIVSNWTGVPVTTMIKSEREKLNKLEKTLSKYVIGQKVAVDEIAKVVKRAKAGIHNPRRPLGSFIFLGPTGVGKTYLAQTLAAEVYKKHNSLIKIDMSEFMERHNISRLVGAPPGYVGYEEAGKLTEEVRRNPYCVILLDEIEKAHPEVFNILLQILEDGFLTDAKGRRINFRNTIIIMTSNIGIEKLNKHASIGFTSKKPFDSQAHWIEARQEILEELKNALKPELINRIDKIIVFEPLNQKAIKQIIKNQFAELQKRLAKQKIELTIRQNAINFLAKVSFEPEYGARPLRRAITEYIENPLSEKILERKIKPGDKVDINFQNKNKTITLNVDKKTAGKSLRKNKLATIATINKK